MFKFLKKIFEKVKSIFSDGFDKVRKFSGVAVNVVDVIKKVVESDVTQIVVDLTPVTVDDVVLDKLKTIVPKVAYKLGVIHGILQVEEDDSEAIEKLILYLKAISPEARVSFWVMLSGELNKALADGELSLAEAIALAQLVYAEKIQK